MATMSASPTSFSIPPESSTLSAVCWAPEREITVSASVRVSNRGLIRTTRRPAMEKRRSRRSISSVLPQNMQPQMTCTQPEE